MSADNGENTSMLFYGALLLNKADTQTNDKEKYLKEAAFYLRKSSDQGNTVSMFLYGLILYNNDSVLINKQKASFYFKQSADAGNYFAMQMYGKMLLKGEGIKTNKTEAAIYFKKALDMGYTNSMFQYGQMLLKGIGIKANKTSAYKYIEDSMKYEIINSELSMNFKITETWEINDTIEILPKNLLIEYDQTYYNEKFRYGKRLLKNGQHEGWYYIMKAADKGVGGAMFKMGKMNYKGNQKYQAAKYFLKLIEYNDNKLAMLYLGLMLFFGDGIQIDIKNGLSFIFLSVYQALVVLILLLFFFFIYRNRDVFTI